MLLMKNLHFILKSDSKIDVAGVSDLDVYAEFFMDLPSSENQTSQDDDIQIDPVRLAQRIDISQYPQLSNLKKFAAEEQYVIMQKLKQRHTEVDLSNRAAELIATKNDFGDELIDIEHFFIDFRLFILSLKLDYMRKLTTSKY